MASRKKCKFFYGNYLSKFNCRKFFRRRLSIDRNTNEIFIIFCAKVYFIYNIYE